MSPDPHKKERLDSKHSCSLWLLLETEVPAASLDCQMLIFVCSKNNAVPGGSLAAAGRAGAARLRGGASSAPHPYHCVLQVGSSISQSRQAFTSILRIGSAHSLTRRGVLTPPPLVPVGGGGDTLAGEGVWADLILTRGQTLWYSSYSIIPQRAILYSTAYFILVCHRRHGLKCLSSS